ncbi:ABC transporter substrate-binding protein, partial [Rhizobiaceae sp. 2RAB30]
MIGYTGFRHALAGLALGMGVAATGMAAAGDAATVEELVKGARSEGELVVLLIHPAKPENKEKIIDAFKKRYDLDIKIDWAPMHPTTLMSRLGAESPSGRFSGDVGAGSIDDLWPSVKKGYVASVNWPALFGDDLPALRSRTEGVPVEMSGTVLSMFDLVYGLIWNKDFVTEDELPKTIADMADPAWKGRLALNSYHVAPIDYLSYEIGGEKTVDLVSKLLENNPVLKAGSGAVGAAVSAGEAPIGTGMA